MSHSNMWVSLHQSLHKPGQDPGTGELRTHNTSEACIEAALRGQLKLRGKVSNALGQKEPHHRPGLPAVPKALLLAGAGLPLLLLRADGKRGEVGKKKKRSEASQEGFDVF